MMMAVAVTLSGFAQWAWMAWHCRRLGIAPKIQMPRLTPRVKELFGKIGPGALGAGAAQINIAISTILASLLPTGAVSYLFYADRLNQLPLGIIGIAIATTLLPILSAKVQANDHDGIKHYTTRALEFGLILGLPAALGLGLASQQIVGVLFEHGAFKADDTAFTAAALRMYVIGIVPFILIKIVSALFFAHHDTKTPVKIALIAVVTNIVLAFLLMRELGHQGIALATSIATWVNFLLLVRALHRSKLLLIDHQLPKRAFKIICSASFMALVLLGANDFVVQALSTHAKIADVFILALYLASAGLIYIIGLQITGAMRLSELKAIIKRDSKK
jgi:putative peptidoglycan lipid II flippase